MSNGDDALVQRIADDLASGRKVSAIKAYRDATGCGLREAKEFVENLIAELGLSEPKPPKTPGGATASHQSSSEIAANPRLVMAVSLLVAILVALLGFVLFFFASN